MGFQDFRKDERIKKSKEIEKIFEEGKLITSEDKKLKAHFIIQEENLNCKIRLGVAVSKKAGSAVWRNRIKRLIREAFRKYKPFINEICKEKKVKIILIISPGKLNQTDNRQVSFQEVEASFNSLIFQVTGTA